MTNKYNIGNVLLSTRKNKKYMVINPDGKMVHFGQKGYADYIQHTKMKNGVKPLGNEITNGQQLINGVLGG